MFGTLIMHTKKAIKAGKENFHILESCLSPSVTDTQKGSDTQRKQRDKQAGKEKVQPDNQLKK